MRARFDHENLKAYRAAVGFCGWVTPVLDALPTKVAARDQWDRASTRVVLNLAERNGKRTYPDRSRFFDIARGSGVESAACLDVLVERGLLAQEQADEGKEQLLGIVSMIGGLLARFAGEGRVQETDAPYGSTWTDENENEKE